MNDLSTKRLIGLLAGFSLTMFAACGEPDDPGADNNDDNNKTPIMMDMGSTADQDPDPKDDGSDPKDDGSDPKDDGSDPKDDGSDPKDDGTDPDGGGDGECERRAMYEGQMGDESPARGGGGVFTLGVGDYVADSGLSQIEVKVQEAIDAGLIVPDDRSTKEIDESMEDILLGAGEEIVITGAVVTSTAFERKNADTDTFESARRLTFQDQQDAALAFLAEPVVMDKDGAPVVLKVGDKVNFKITALKAFGGTTPQITTMTEVEKVGADVNVGVMEKTGEALTEEDWQKMVRVHGVITALPELGDDGMPRGCGGSNFCYELTHGGQKTVLRVSDKLSRAPQVDDCVTFVGPVGSFPGPLATTAPTWQLDAVNFGWYRGPFGD